MSDRADSYTLTDLADLSDVTPRTVRYYVQQGLLRSPEVAGPNTRYDEGHLWRLRLIRQLQREHLPLAEIRKRLLAMDDDEVRSLVGGTPQAVRGSAADYIGALLRSRGVPASGRERVSRPAAAPPRPAAAPPHAPAAAHEPAPAPSLSRSAEPPSHGPPDRSQWERLTLAPDIELHIRRPLSRLDNRRVDRLISIARQLLEEDTP